MKVYFGASISLDRKMLPVYQNIVAELKQQGHEVLSEHVVDPNLIPGGGLSPQVLFRRETDTIDRADVMVADVSVPSWGTAFLIEHALNQGKPVLVLYYQETEVPLPMMIAGHPDLYVEHYDLDSLKTVLKRSFDHFQEIPEMKGKLVVLDGGDGSGKSTQMTLLLKYFEDHHLKHRYISFPRYHTSFHGRHVGRFLTGEFGKNDEVSPYLSSLAFALDRLTAKDEMVEWLKEGYIVLADRYVSANMAHQGSKLTGQKQQEFIDWVYQMEYKEHKLPKEDLVVYLYVPVEAAQQLLQKGDRKIDMADTDIDHQRRSIAMYQELSQRFPHWVMVKCVDNQGKLLSIQAIHEQILAVLKERGIIAI